MSFSIFLQNLTSNYASFQALTVCHPTDTLALTHRNRAHVIDSTISLLSDFEQMAIRYDTADAIRKCNSGLTYMITHGVTDTCNNYHAFLYGHLSDDG